MASDGVPHDDVGRQIGALENKLREEGIVIRQKCGNAGITRPGAFFCTKDEEECVIKIGYLGSGPECNMAGEHAVLKKCSGLKGIPEAEAIWGW